jgi:hypothetical protein
VEVTGSVTGSVRFRRGGIRAVSPEAVAARLAEIREVAAAFGVPAVAAPLEQAATEALAVARTEEEAELARRLLHEVRRARHP